MRFTRGTMVMLQRLASNEERKAFLAGLGRDAFDLDVHDDLRDVLAALSLLDEYVGVSNTYMHLLACLEGRSARALLARPAEWRWLVEGDTSPWFPTFRLYRQQVIGDWTAPLAQLKADL
jgi:hypothetical protein